MMDRESIKSNDRRIIQRLIDYRLGSKSKTDGKKQFDEYMYGTFDCFCRNKIHIVLELERLQTHGDKKLLDIIIYIIIRQLSVCLSVRYTTYVHTFGIINVRELHVMCGIYFCIQIVFSHLDICNK